MKEQRVMMNAGTSGFPDGCELCESRFDAAFLIFDEYVVFADSCKKRMGRGYEADPDYYHEGQTGRIFYYSLRVMSGCKIFEMVCPRSFGFRVALGSMSASGYTMMFGSIDKQFKKRYCRTVINTGNGVVM